MVTLQMKKKMLPNVNEVIYNVWFQFIYIVQVDSLTFAKCNNYLMKYTVRW